MSPITITSFVAFTTNSPGKILRNLHVFLNNSGTGPAHRLPSVQELLRFLPGPSLTQRVFHIQVIEHARHHKIDQIGNLRGAIVEPR